MAKLNLSPSLSLPLIFSLCYFFPIASSFSDTGSIGVNFHPHRRQSSTTIPSSSPPQVARPELGQALRLRPGGPHSPLWFRHFRHRRSPQRAPLLCLLPPIIHRQVGPNQHHPLPPLNPNRIHRRRK
ncbi:hypothetical protein CsSME_00038960 [Camellia sinensis var. sinensis]